MNACNFFEKFVQARDVFICDFIDAIKACERDLYKMYVDLVTSYDHGDGILQAFLDVVDHTYDPLHMVWIVEPTFSVEYVRFQFFSCTYKVHKRDPLTSCLSYVS